MRVERATGKRWRPVGSIVVGTLTAAATWPAVYLGLLTAVGLPRARLRRTSSDAMHGEPTNEFAILVPAHDEAGGIGATLRSFRELDYPPGRFSVHVVADNCNDDTADVVRSAGWIVHERTDPEHPGKGPALNWLFDRLVRSERFEAIVVVDADTTLHPGFLRAMDVALGGGAKAAQGHYSVREPGDSPSASFRYAALACRHHLRPLARCRLGASSGLYGNGMMFRRDVMTGRRWTGDLVEDAEFQLELLLDGERVVYVPEAVLWAEMPHDIAQATSQNERWERGRLELVRRYVPTLIRRVVTDRRGRVALADAALDLAVPPISVLVAMLTVSTSVATIGAASGRRLARGLLGANIAAVATVTAHILAGLVAVRAPRSVYRHLWSAPVIVLWKVRLWWSVAVSRDEVTWTRTQRNSETAA